MNIDGRGIVGKVYGHGALPGEGEGAVELTCLHRRGNHLTTKEEEDEGEGGEEWEMRVGDVKCGGTTDGSEGREGLCTK